MANLWRAIPGRLADSGFSLDTNAGLFTLNEFFGALPDVVDPADDDVDAPGPWCPVPWGYVVFGAQGFSFRARFIRANHPDGL